MIVVKPSERYTFFDSQPISAPLADMHQPDRPFVPSVLQSTWAELSLEALRLPEHSLR